MKHGETIPSETIPKETLVTSSFLFLVVMASNLIAMAKIDRDQTYETSGVSLYVVSFRPLIIVESCGALTSCKSGSA